MIFIPEILLICLFIFLYAVFIYAKDNFVLLRKNVTLEQLFNLIFINFFFSILISRFFYVVEHVNIQYLNPFLLFQFFRLSFAGGILASIGILYYQTRKKKMPFWNVFDIFALSLFLSVSIGIFFVSIGELFMTRKFLLPILVDGIVNLLIFTICSSLFFKSKLKDGSIGFITYAVLVIMQSGTSIWLRGKTAFAHILAEDIFLFLLTLVFLMLFFYKQYIVSHVKKK